MNEMFIKHYKLTGVLSLNVKTSRKIHKLKYRVVDISQTLGGVIAICTCLLVLIILFLPWHGTGVGIEEQATSGGRRVGQPHTWRKYFTKDLEDNFKGV